MSRIETVEVCGQCRQSAKTEQCMATPLVVARARPALTIVCLNYLFHIDQSETRCPCPKQRPLPSQTKICQFLPLKRKDKAMPRAAKATNNNSPLTNYYGPLQSPPHRTQVIDLTDRVPLP
jgi:hypothetical protein